MKCLFLKQAESCGGPWASFEYDKVTPQWILSKALSKAGHPIPMICLMKMDCKIIKNGPNQRWFDAARRSNKNYDQTLKKYTEGAINITDVDFSSYDLVWCEDSFVDKEVIRQNKHCVWVFNNAEHTYPTQDNGYDLFFDHRKRTFPCDDGDLIHEYSMLQKNGIFIEWRSTLINDIKEDLKNATQMKLDYDMNPLKHPQMITNPPTSGELYWKRLGSNKYYVQLPYKGSVRLGQAFIDAASMGLYCVGLGQKKEVIHPFCRVVNTFEASNVIRTIEKDDKLKKEIALHQCKYLDSLVKEFKNTMTYIMNEKRGKH